MEVGAEVPPQLEVGCPKKKKKKEDHAHWLVSGIPMKARTRFTKTLSPSRADDRRGGRIDLVEFPESHKYKLLRITIGYRRRHVRALET